MALDGVLLQTSPEAHVMAAVQITTLWSEQHSDFQSQLVKRAEHWRQRQVRVGESWRDRTGACDRLMELLAVPGDIAPGVRAPRKGTKKKPSRRHPKAPISDEEVRRFLELIDEEGLDACSTPGYYTRFVTKGQLSGLNTQKPRNRPSTAQEARSQIALFYASTSPWGPAGS